MRRRLPTVHELRRRLERLRSSLTWLRAQAGIGADLRAALAEAGSPVWRPSEDLCWRSWIERNGDDYARSLIAAIDAEVGALAAKRAAEASAASVCEATDGQERTQAGEIGSV